MLKISRKHSLFQVLNELQKQADKLERFAGTIRMALIDGEVFECDSERDKAYDVADDFYDQGEALRSLPGKAYLQGRDEHGNLEIFPEDRFEPMWFAAQAEAKALRECARAQALKRQEHEFFNLQARLKLA